MTDNIFSEIFLPITLAIITFGLGLSIRVQDIRNIVFRPRNIAVGVGGQLIILPLIAFSIALISGMRSEMAVGLVLISICPGGATSNLVTFMIRGNVALSVSMTVVNSLVTLFTIPLIAQLSLDVFMDRDASIHLPFLNTVFNIFRITVLPATAGILVRHYREALASRLEEPLRYVLPVLLLLVYSGVLFLEQGEGEIRLSDFFRLVPYALALNVFALLGGLYIPWLFGIKKINRVTMAIELGLQNSTLAIFVASGILNMPSLGMMAVVYGSFSFFTTWGFGYLARKYL